MSSSASLPMPVGARIAPSRSVAQAWAAPRAADLVLDPWAAPTGAPIAQMLLSPWPAPSPSMRIATMAPPVLTGLPDLAESTAALARSTDDALAAIGAVTARRAAFAPPLPAPTPASAAPVESPDVADGTTTEAAVTASATRLRARMWAMIAGGAAAAAGVVALIATAL